MDTLATAETRTDEHFAPTRHSLTERYHSLDALRAFALLLGVVFHSILTNVLPPGIWAVGTTAPATPLLWFTYYTHCFRMEAFFLLAGFFAQRVMEKRGAAAFLRDRVKRIFLVFLVALYPMKLLLASGWVTGGLKTGWLKLPPEAASLPIWRLSLGGLGMESWPNINLTHLWFLYYLSCISGLFLAARWLIRKWIDRAPSVQRKVDLAFRWVTSSWLVPLCLALATTPLLTRMSGTDVDTPDKGFAWNYPVLLLYGFYFCLGTLLKRNADLLGILGRRWKFFLPLSLVMSIVTGMGIGLRIAGGTSSALRWATSFGTSLTMSLAVLGWIGLFVRVCDRPSAWIRYLSDASYWVY